MLKLILISDQFPTNLSPPATAEALVLRNESASAQIQSGENKDFSGPTQMEAPQEQGRVRGSVGFFFVDVSIKCTMSFYFVWEGRGWGGHAFLLRSSAWGREEGEKKK